MAQWDVIYAWTGSNYTNVSSQYKQYYEQKLASLKKEIAATEEQNERAEQAANVESGGSAASTSGLMARWSSGDNGNAPNHASSGSSESAPAQPPAPAEPDRLGLDCTKAEAAKIERFLGNRDASMSDAIKWKNSDNPYDREFAAWILADIGSPEASGDLQESLHDPNRAMARNAKYALQQLKQNPEKYTVDHDFIPVVAGKPTPQ